MPLFMLKKQFFEQYKSGEKDVELRSVKPQWKNSKIGDEAVLQSGRNFLRKRITKVHRGTLARIFRDVDYKRIFPEAKTVFEAVRETRKIYPKEEEFMAFELV
jgi:ASC-1-like (ASCH) protein